MAKADITLDASRLTEQLAQVIENSIEELVEEAVEEVKPVDVGFKRLNENAVIPSKAHASDSGFDLVASEYVVIEPGETVIVPTGIAIQLPKGYEAQVRPRSGVTAKTKLRVQIGTIDEGYGGEIGVIIDNTSQISSLKMRELFVDDKTHNSFDDISYKIRKGDRIAQLVVQRIPKTVAIEVTDVELTERGDGGFGSSGVRT